MSTYVLLNFASCLACWWLLGKLIIIQCKSPNLFTVNVLAMRPCPEAGLHLECAAERAVLFSHLETHECKYMFHKLLRSRVTGTTVKRNYACSTSYFRVAHKLKHKLLIVDICGGGVVFRSYMFLHSSNNISRTLQSKLDSNLVSAILPSSHRNSIGLDNKCNGYPQGLARVYQCWKPGKSAMFCEHVIWTCDMSND